MAKSFGASEMDTLGRPYLLEKPEETIYVFVTVSVTLPPFLAYAFTTVPQIWEAGGAY